VRNETENGDEFVANVTVNVNVLATVTVTVIENATIYYFEQAYSLSA
jgi:hypothetical protein